MVMNYEVHGALGLVKAELCSPQKNLPAQGRSSGLAITRRDPLLLLASNNPSPSHTFQGFSGSYDNTMLGTCNTGLCVFLLVYWLGSRPIIIHE